MAPSSRELPAKRGEGELTLGSPAAFAAALYVAGTAPNRAKLLPSRRKSGGDPPPSEREAVRKNRRLSSIGPKLNRNLSLFPSDLSLTVVYLYFVSTGLVFSRLAFRGLKKRANLRDWLGRGGPYVR